MGEGERGARGSIRRGGGDVSGGDVFGGGVFGGGVLGGASCARAGPGPGPGPGVVGSIVGGVRRGSARGGGVIERTSRDVRWRLESRAGEGGAIVAGGRRCGLSRARAPSSLGFDERLHDLARARRGERLRRWRGSELVIQGISRHRVGHLRANARGERARALEVGGRRRPVRAGRHGRVERPRLRRGRALAERRGCARRGRAHVRAGGLEIPAEGSTPGPARHGDPRDAPKCGFAIRRRGRGKAIDRRLRSGRRAHVRENAESRNCSSREFRNLPRGVPPRRLLLHGGIPLARFLLRTPAREPSCSPQRPRHFLRARDHDDHMASSLTLPFLSFSGIKLVPVRYARVASRTRVSLHASTLVPRPC